MVKYHIPLKIKTGLGKCRKDLQFWNRNSVATL